MQHAVLVEVVHASGDVSGQSEPQGPGEGLRPVLNQLLQSSSVDIL